jgi:hypothetical protein
MGLTKNIVFEWVIKIKKYFVCCCGTWVSGWEQ